MAYPTKIYQNQIADLVWRKMGKSSEVKTEWRSMAGSPDMYCPTLDVAVGPFALSRKYMQEYDIMFDRNKIFFNRLLWYHNDNVLRYSGTLPSYDRNGINGQNRNARCFLAIEIENCVSRKHMLGGAVNASGLGRIGIVVGWTDEKVKAFVKLLEYWNFLRKVKENNLNTKNLIILDQQQLKYTIQEYLS